jgi:hypothetical protein
MRPGRHSRFQTAVRQQPKQLTVTEIFDSRGRNWRRLVAAFATRAMAGCAVLAIQLCSRQRGAVLTGIGALPGSGFGWNAVRPLTSGPGRAGSENHEEQSMHL